MLVWDNYTDLKSPQPARSASRGSNNSYMTSIEGLPLT
ncbi:hypothetical protein OOU_Y34scaffold00203g72 [Pyricularia oryzae Y34]|uniref:Uncharacterized protein n=2 Tax=Pyricularia oryzae TaxID=318829 RepID=A0AA97P5W6_PYRO3|nr:hypothetical protein OOU_Y34scaffold00203g72 [Pyricularia oryzae Y34]